ncbi:hypothetical protein SAMN06272735_1631 [Streptomyces sp. TLI_55]|uniref:hypothetical protein n=1 Tax=Streptomyces sp. TLI_55 TaxID=1938861 RepID=UPI000BD51BDD|nr:hypothetical protein [Streptomyces sp. TLI_55]SNX57166.1 hypothetical protein SAMN06272735_1631 [Streptomyces sp. TLI_55]
MGEGGRSERPQGQEAGRSERSSEGGGGRSSARGSSGEGTLDASPRFPSLRARSLGGASASRTTPPPPRASARFPDAPPAQGVGSDGAGTAVPPRPPHRPPASPRRDGAAPESASESTFRLRRLPTDRGPERDAQRDPAGPTSSASAPDTAAAPLHPDPALSWNAPGAGRPVVSFGEPEGYGEGGRPRPLGVRGGARTAAVAVCLVLGLGLIGGAVTGSWLVGDSAAAGDKDSFTAAEGLWHSVPVDQLFPPTVQGQGAGPGGADRTWTRIAVAPDSGCKDAFDPLLAKALAPVGCRRLLRATYTDATQSYVTTVGLLFTKADAAGMTALDTRFTKERLGDRADLMPRPYPAEDTAAADFGAKQRASWAVSVLTDAPVVVYAVSGWADGRTVDEPQSAAAAMQSGATTSIAQAGLGHEAQGLADRVERGLRRTVHAPATEGTGTTS